MRRLAHLTAPLVILWLLILVFVGAALADSVFGVRWFSVDSGGGTSAGGSFAVSGSIGQSDAGTLVGGSYAVSGGFWQPVARSGPIANQTPTPTANPAWTATPTPMPRPAGTTTPTATAPNEQPGNRTYLPMLVRGPAQGVAGLKGATEEPLGEE